MSLKCITNYNFLSLNYVPLNSLFQQANTGNGSEFVLIHADNSSASLEEDGESHVSLSSPQKTDGNN